MQNKELAEELHQPNSRKLEKRKVNSYFTDNTWGLDLADIQLLSNFIEGICILMCVVDICSKCSWVIPLKDKKGITITNTFPKFLDESGRKPNKISIDKGCEFYNRSNKSGLQENDIEMYSTHNEGKSVVAERFIRTLKNKFYKYMISISKNVYINKLFNIVNECNNTYRSTIKMKSVDIKSSTFIDFNKKNKKGDRKFKVGDHVRIGKYKNILANGYVPHWSEAVFVINKC